MTCSPDIEGRKHVQHGEAISALRNIETAVRVWGESCEGHELKDA